MDFLVDLHNAKKLNGMRYFYAPSGNNFIAKNSSSALTGPTDSAEEPNFLNWWNSKDAISFASTTSQVAVALIGIIALVLGIRSSQLQDRQQQQIFPAEALGSGSTRVRSSFLTESEEK
ncbi:MAG: hypothetical protein HQL31_08550 [Planctomycetes bacterium]|nr:hypothetical protein [Planctomycetota bacterium]